MRKIAKIKIKSITPVGLGWHEKELYDDLLPLRPFSVRGIIRWWARALIAGVAFDAGKHEINITKKIINDVFGGAEKEPKSSSISIRIHVERVSKLTQQDIKKLISNARIRLLTMGMEEEEIKTFIENAFRKDIVAEIELYSLFKDPNEFNENLAIVSTILAFTLGGVGKASRRGFGAFKITEVNPGDSISENTEGLIKKLRNNIIRDDDNINIIKNKLKKILEISRGVIINKLNLGTPPSRLPRIHAITQSNYFSLFIKDIRELNIPDAITALNFIQEIFLRNPKQMPRNIRSLSSILQDAYGLQAAKQIGSYFEGLPRSASRKNVYRLVNRRLHQCLRRNNVKGDITTGFETEKAQRRASPIIVTFINEKTIAFSIFLSNDWPDEILWTSLHMINSRTRRPPSPRRGIFADQFLLRTFKFNPRQPQSLRQIRSVICSVTPIGTIPQPNVITLTNAYRITCNYFRSTLKCTQVW